MDIEGQWGLVAGVAYAIALGGVIGFERELKNRPAGFRTHMLVAAASAFLAGLGQLVVHDPRFRDDGGLLTMDPLRMVEAVIAGVSFIGAGTIFASRGGQAVAGITTAASLLSVAVIGVAVGLDYYLLATAVTALVLAVLAVLDVVERRVAKRAAANASAEAAAEDRDARAHPPAGAEAPAKADPDDAPRD